MRNLLLILLIASSPVWAQLETDTITIAASRQVNLQPDQIVFNVQVLAPNTAGLDAALAKVAGTGITAADLTGVYNSSNDNFSWVFSLPVPVSQAGATATLLAQLQQQSKQTVQFYAQETRISPALQQSQGCSQANLVSDARTQAQNLAAATGFSVGPVLAVSDGSGPPFIPSAVRIQTFASILQVGAILSSSAPIYVTPPLTCAAVVKFRLFRYH